MHELFSLVFFAQVRKGLDEPRGTKPLLTSQFLASIVPGELKRRLVRFSLNEGIVSLQTAEINVEPVANTLPLFVFQ